MHLWKSLYSCFRHQSDGGYIAVEKCSWLYLITKICDRTEYIEWVFFPTWLIGADQQVWWVFMRPFKLYCHCNRSSSLTHRLLNLPDTQPTTHGWRSVGPALIGLALKDTLYLWLYWTHNGVVTLRSVFRKSKNIVKALPRTQPYRSKNNTQNF